MFKKMLIASAILVSSSAAFAGAPYVGTSVGVTHSNLTNTSDSNNANVNFFGGYGAIVNQKVYLGGEGFVSVTPGDIQSNNYYDTKYRYSAGASFIPGYMITEDLMAYARAGLIRSSYKIEAGSYHDTEYSNGVQTGLGLQTHLTQKLDVRGEYVYTSYRSSSPYVDNSNQLNVGLVYKFE